MDTTKWLTANAAVMAADRPDCWDETDAFTTLTKWYYELAAMPEGGSIGSAGWELIRNVYDGEVTYELVRKVSDVSTYEGEPGVHIFNWTVNSQLLKDRLDLPYHN